MLKSINKCLTGAFLHILFSVSVPVTAFALLSVPQHLTDGDPNSINNCSKYVSFPKEPAIQLINNKNNRACRTTEMCISKHGSWHTVNNTTEKPQLNFKEKPHLDSNISVRANLVQSNCPTRNYREKNPEIKSHELNQTSPQRKWSLRATRRKIRIGNKVRLLFFRNSHWITTVTARSFCDEK